MGVIRAANALWAIVTDDIRVALSKIGGTAQIVIINIQALSNTPQIGVTRFIQDRETILFTPLWVNVTWNGTTWIGSAFIFNSFPVAPRLRTFQYFNTYVATDSMYIFFRGDGSATAKTQSQFQNNVLYTGNIVGIYTEKTSLLNPTIPIGTIIIINAIIIKTTRVPVLQNNGTFNYTYIEGIIMIGSAVPVTSYTKKTVYVREDNGVYNNWNSYCNNISLNILSLH